MLPHERQAACHLAGALEQGSFHCLIADQVAREFDVQDDDIQEDARKAIKRLQEQVERTNNVHGVFEPAVPVSLAHLKDQVEAARAVVGRWIAASHRAIGTPDALGRAMNRVNFAIPPSRKGKDSMKDCLVYETYLEVVGVLRAAKMTSLVVFLSSNTKEYQLPAIAAEFGPLGMSYAPNMTAAKHQLGL